MPTLTGGGNFAIPFEHKAHADAKFKGCLQQQQLPPPKPTDTATVRHAWDHCNAGARSSVAPGGIPFVRQSTCLTPALASTRGCSSNARANIFRGVGSSRFGLLPNASSPARSPEQQNGFRFSTHRPQPESIYVRACAARLILD